MSANLERLEKHNPEGALLKYLKEVESRLQALEEKKGEKAKKK